MRSSRRSRRSYSPNYYRILGVPPHASQRDIKQAFRKRALECHPDRAAAGEQEASADEFVRLREAFDVLSDPHERKQYDAWRRNRDSSSPRRGTSRRRQRSSRTRTRRTRSTSNTAAHKARARGDRYTRRARNGRFAEAWRDESPDARVWMGSMSNRINGLANKHQVLHQHHRTLVPAGAFIGAAVFLANPTIIHTTGSLVIDLMLCIIISAACGFAVSMIGGTMHLLMDSETGW